MLTAYILGVNRTVINTKAFEDEQFAGPDVHGGMNQGSILSKICSVLLI